MADNAMHITNGKNVSTITEILSLVRVQQWYKNLVVFLAIFFSGNMLQGSFWLPSLLAFLSLSFMSSAGYILNDLRDLPQDRLHPEKKKRALASGTVGKPFAIVLFLAFLTLSLALALFINNPSGNISFIIFPISLFFLSLLYSFVLKNIVFADILAIASLFTLRAVSGAYAINVYVSPWLLLCPFFLALFLAAGKRHADVLLLHDKAGATRETLYQYTPTITKSLITISTTAAILCYALYSLLSGHQYLWYTLHFALFVMLRYYHLIITGSEIARHPEKLLKDH